MTDTIYGATGCTLTIASVEATAVKDVQFTKNATKVDQTARVHDGYKSERPGLISWGITFKMIHVVGDSMYSTLETAFNNRAKLAVVITNGTRSKSGDAYVTKFDESQPLDGIVEYDVEMVGDGALT